MRVMFVLLFFVLLSSFVFGAEGEITLVTIGESSSGSVVGGTADLFLVVKSGSGRIFIDSFPFTREDTQVSIRFARDVACNFLEVDCSRLDFFYTINIGSSSVGGPSAGAAIAVLTIGVLNNDVLDDGVVITGTINSGGIIGPVSGLEGKAVAARDAGFSKILVPRNSVLVNKTLSGLNDSISGSDNVTVFYADSLVVSGIDIVPVSTLEEALFEFTGVVYPDFSYDVVVSDQYQFIMERVASQLCNRSFDIIDLVSDDVKLSHESEFEDALDYVSLGVNASESFDFYSAASFCFSANSILRSLEFESYDFDILVGFADDLVVSIDNSLDELNARKLRTLSDLETYIIVKERLLEAKSLLEEDSFVENLGYIVERRYSAIAWSSFFDFVGKDVVLDDNYLSDACIAKISEADERLSYIDFLIGSVFDRSELDEARFFFDSGDFAFCIFRASKVKADANAIILSMYLSRDRVGELIDDQLAFARMQINKQGDDFPILGYSYYNYASTLRDSRPQLSMIFAEYASEFSNLGMYFPSERRVPWRLIIGSYEVFLLGVLVGFFVFFSFLLGLILFFRFRSSKVIKKHVVKRRKFKGSKK
ncbi:hypothetical protein KO361_03875 [Candidatus Woesearchaeota archaeon]|nr:hypothetical protein [Candidatus Woesearchaeota archaeon]